MQANIEQISIRAQPHSASPTSYLCACGEPQPSEKIHSEVRSHSFSHTKKEIVAFDLRSYLVSILVWLSMTSHFKKFFCYPTNQLPHLSSTTYNLTVQVHEHVNTWLPGMRQEVE